MSPMPPMPPPPGIGGGSFFCFPATIAFLGVSREATQGAALIPGREQCERTRNPDLNSEPASGFRVNYKDDVITGTIR